MEQQSQEGLPTKQPTQQNLVSVKREGEGGTVRIATQPTGPDLNVSINMNPSPTLDDPPPRTPAGEGPNEERPKGPMRPNERQPPAWEERPKGPMRPIERQPSRAESSTPDLAPGRAWGRAPSEHGSEGEHVRRRPPHYPDLLGIDDLANPQKQRTGGFPPARSPSPRDRGSMFASDSETASLVSVPRSRKIHRRSRTPTPALKPSPGYATLKEEKLHILLALRRMKEDGVKGITAFDMDSDLEEMRIELKAFQQDETIKNGIQFCRSTLVTFAAGLEIANAKFNPFDLDMQGFSESLFERIERYDGVFERLTRKYSKKASAVSPEMQLLTMFVGNAFTFCFTKAMMKAVTPSMTKIAEENPEMVQKMMEGIMKEQMAKGVNPSFVQQQQPPANGFSNLMDPPMTTRGEFVPTQRVDIAEPKTKKRVKRPRSETSEESSESTGSEYTTTTSEGTSASESTKKSAPKKKKAKGVDGSETGSLSVSSIDLSGGNSSFSVTVPKKRPAPAPAGVRTTVRKVAPGRQAGGTKVAKLEVEIK
ncbi:hypothetical protein KFL_004900016 [Klebsormidium nitens]|uniref:Uncharacterized protein n=1 Tax=Klebsormidium nitens TaxID=105231 RepID=A0A1Y1IDV0_KLENI|nr:hypothetical protein KFL_004900016 [Klebsormidium nitens]|eukprot:GAQ89134.1 hypothetical protein KFL_004900016 [Klebsormidium nitens]